MKPPQEFSDLAAEPSSSAAVSGELPCAGGLIAGTLALMTTWADPPDGPDGACAAQRPLLARKIVSNLFFLRHHPDLGEPMRLVIGKVHERWLPMAAEGMHREAAAAAGLH
jgi:hypothetical protein